MPKETSRDLLIRQVVGRLEPWLDSMRGPTGYTGPVAHWWDSALVYTGVMLDWRYEGIICGYLNLYGSSGEDMWLQKACRAADDLVAGQLSDARFRNSSFEHGPRPGGTPHEAAVDIALLEVAQVLKHRGDSAWQGYYRAAERNIQEYQIARLWNGSGFQDQPEVPVLVANKNATTLEAMLLYQLLGAGDMSEYIARAAQVILSSQVKQGPRAGATIHHGTFRYKISFGIYTARCVGALARLMEVWPQQAYRRFIAQAASYLASLVDTRGTFLGHYAHTVSHRRVPVLWGAPSGELLRAQLLAREWVEVPGDIIEVLISSLASNQLPVGGCRTALGLNLRNRTLAGTEPPDFRDLLPVVGWNDKAFRALTMLTSAVEPAHLKPVELPCRWRNRDCLYQEDSQSISLVQASSHKKLYHWRKGASYPAIMELWS